MGSGRGSALGPLRASLRARGNLWGVGHASYLLISAFASYLGEGPEMGLSGSREPWASSQQSPVVRTRTANQRARSEMGPDQPHPWQSGPAAWAAGICDPASRTAPSSKLHPAEADGTTSFKDPEGALPEHSAGSCPLNASVLGGAVLWPTGPSEGTRADAI